MTVFPKFEFDVTLPAALIAIDMQDCGVNPTTGLAKAIERTSPGFTDYLVSRIRTTVVPSIRALQDAFHSAGQSVVFMAFGSATGDGTDVTTSTIRYRDAARRALTGASVILPRTDPTTDVLDDIPVAEQDIVMTKTTMDSFWSTELDATLKARGVKTLVITGVYTDACVESTARSAAELGYQVIVAEDACAAWRPEFHEASLANLERYFARVESSDWVVKAISASEDSRAS